MIVVDAYQYRGRPLNSEAMRELIPELFEGRTLKRQEIIDETEQEHRRRGGKLTQDASNRGPLTGRFKKASEWLRAHGAMENAGTGYWRVIGEPRRLPDDAEAKPTTRRDSRSDETYHIHMKRALYAWQNGRCAECSRYHDRAVDFDLDHIRPRARGGGDEPANLQLLCRRCNTRKGSR